MELKTDPEFESLVPPPTDDELQQLETNLLADGCRDALIVWDGVIIDGHSRYRICRRHGLDFKTENKHFECREDAVIWICNNQIGRRNLSPEWKSYLRGKDYNANKKKNGRPSKDKKGCHSDTFSKTAEAMSVSHGVAPRTIKRDAKYAKGVDAIGAVSPTAKQMLLSGKTPVTKKEVVEAAEKAGVEIVDIARKIETGAYAKPDAPAKQNQEAARGGRPENSIQRHVAELKNSDIDRNYTTRYYLQEYSAFAERFIRDLKSYDNEPYHSLESSLTDKERDELSGYNRAIITAVQERDSKITGV